CKSDSEEEFERVTDEPIEHSSYFVYYEMDGLVDYYVTAMYKNMGKLEESEPSNIVRVEVGSQIGVPMIEPPAGTYQNEIEVSIETQEANAVVFYTLDGTEPGVESVEYIEPFVLSENSTVTVRSYKKGRLCSDVFKVDYTFETSDVDKIEMVSLPFDLRTYPNPFHMKRHAERGLEAFHIEYSLNKDYEKVELAIYNIKGELINKIYPKYKSKGEHLLSWDFTSRANIKIRSGMYFIRLQTEEKSVNKKILLIK
ncbi:MAG: chitobiase/beta-hexosaminidase C-terminal domain-containing protein, partial [Candidatus Cloacimonas sp.]|nr:chitobiase/beta-hexosaminidase C-terminal domain-containing protein [Candidatus Cloacimonadota bacterium]